MNDRAPRYELLSSAAAPDRAPPHSAEAEAHVLACCLIDGRDTIARALAEGLTPKTFYSPVNAILFETIVDLYRRTPPVSLEMLAEELRTRRQLDAVGGMEHLLFVANAAPTTAHAGYFLGQVREFAARRWLVALGTGLVEQAYAATGPVEPLFRGHMTDLQRGLARVLSAAQLPKSLGDEIDAVVADLRSRAAGTADQSGWVFTGWPYFDRQMLPFGCQRVDHLVLVAGYSGDGKSALMVQWGGVALDRGQRVRAYTRETDVGGFIETLVAQRVGLDLKQPDRAPPERLEAFYAECARLKADCAGTRLWCVEQTGATPLNTIDELAADARMFAKTQGAPHLWIVDYAQLFGTKWRFGSAREQNDYISGVLQSLCRELGGVWLVGCQLNETTRREKLVIKHDDGGKLIHHMPDRGDLRESQKYYHDADRVLFIYRPPEDSRGSEQTAINVACPEQWIVQDKRRKGGRGFIRTHFEKCFVRFVPFGSADDRTPAGPGAAPASKAAFKGQKAAPPPLPPPPAPTEPEETGW